MRSACRQQTTCQHLLPIGWWLYRILFHRCILQVQEMQICQLSWIHSMCTHSLDESMRYMLALPCCHVVTRPPIISLLFPRGARAIRPTSPYDMGTRTVWGFPMKTSSEISCRIDAQDTSVLITALIVDINCWYHACRLNCKAEDAYE